MEATEPAGVTRPAFRYYGGKWKLAPWIISYFPKHQHYIEPCGGAASVLLQKPLSAIETYNDLNGDVVNFFKVLRERTGELAHAVGWTPWSRQEFEESRVCEGDDLERARLFWVYQTMGLDAAPGKGSKTGLRLDSTSVYLTDRVDRDRTVEGLYSTAHRLRAVQFESRPMNDIVKRLDGPEVLFYIDPPYVSGTRTHGKDMYGVEWNDDEHAEFIELARAMKGYCVISGYACDLYEPLEAVGWIREDRKAVNNSGGTRVESVWLCPRTVADKGGRLF